MNSHGYRFQGTSRSGKRRGRLRGISFRRVFRGYRHLCQGSGLRCRYKGENRCQGCFLLYASTCLISFRQRPLLYIKLNWISYTVKRCGIQVNFDGAVKGEQGKKDVFWLKYRVLLCRICLPDGKASER